MPGATIGGNDPISLSGHHALRIALARRGHEPDTFATVVLTGGHHRSLDLVARGDLDAAVVDSVVRTARSRVDARVAALRVVERLGPWPTQPLVARCTMADDAVAEVSGALLRAGANPVVRAALGEAALRRLVPVASDHCDPVVAALGTTGPARQPGRL